MRPAEGDEHCRPWLIVQLERKAKEMAEAQVRRRVTKDEWTKYKYWKSRQGAPHTKRPEISTKASRSLIGVLRSLPPLKTPPKRMPR